MADRRSMPLPPLPDLAAMSIRDLATLADYFAALSSAALGIFNQPRVEGVVARYVDDHWHHSICDMSDAIMAEIEARAPSDRREAEERAQALIRYHLAGDDFERIVALAFSAVKHLKGRG